MAVASRAYLAALLTVTASCKHPVTLTTDICAPAEREELTVEVERCASHTLVDVTALHFRTAHGTNELAHIVEGHLAMVGTSEDGSSLSSGDATGEFRVRTQTPAIGVPAWAHFSFDLRRSDRIGGSVQILAPTNSKPAATAWLHRGIEWTLKDRRFARVQLYRPEMEYKVDKLIDEGVAKAWRRCLAEANRPSEK